MNRSRGEHEYTRGKIKLGYDCNQVFCGVNRILKEQNFVG